MNISIELSPVMIMTLLTITYCFLGIIAAVIASHYTTESDNIISAGIFWPFVAISLVIGFIIYRIYKLLGGK